MFPMLADKLGSRDGSALVLKDSANHVRSFLGEHNIHHVPHTLHASHTSKISALGDINSRAHFRTKVQKPAIRIIIKSTVPANL